LVVPPDDADGAGGMEYPMLVTLEQPVRAPFGLGDGVRVIEIVTIHEIAHQWAPMQAASNEGAEAWLDEGFADYATTRVLSTLYPPDRTVLDVGPFHVGYESLHRSQFLIGGVREPLAQPAWQYRDFLAYGVTVYSKGTLVLLTLERVFGEERFLNAMKKYFDRWRWRHPTTLDLQRSLEADLGAELDSFFQPLVFGTGVAEFGVRDLSPRAAVITRRGDVQIPVDIGLTYTDGRTDRLTWDSQGEQLQVTGTDGELAQVQIDPDGKLRIEPTRLDDGRDLSPSPLPLLTVAARILGLIQSALLAGMLG
jgi:aminopeptidase N